MHFKTRTHTQANLLHPVAKVKQVQNTAAFFLFYPICLSSLFLFFHNCLITCKLPSEQRELKMWWCCLCLGGGKREMRKVIRAGF